MRRRLSALLATAIFALGAAGAQAADVHSDNARLVGGLDLGGLLTDIAFWGDTAAVGFLGDPLDPLDDGIRIIDVSKPERPRLLGSITCPGGHYDVSIWQELLIVSVNELQENAACGDAPDENSGESFAGLQIISIANPKRPVRVASVPLCLDGPVGPGSHNNTIVPDLDRPVPRLIVYSSITCVEVVEIPLADPAKARRLGSVDAFPDIGCHDVTVHLERRIAWCGFFQSQIWDIADPANPRRLSIIENPLLDEDHSATFSADGRIVAISDERFVDRTPVCHGGTLIPSGAVWFYDVSDPSAPVLRGVHQLQYAGIDAFCTAHQTNLVPLPDDRDVMTIAWYRGGMEVVDFTDPTRPRVLAHFIGSPHDPERFGQPWAAYWYRGHIYLTNTGFGTPAFDYRSLRGLEVVRVDDQALAGAIELTHLNAQTQEPVVADPSTPRADRPPSCARWMTLRVRGVRSARARVGGLRLRVVRRRGRLAVDLRELPEGRHRVVLRVRLRGGRTRVIRRNVTCPSRVER